MLRGLRVMRQSGSVERNAWSGRGMKIQFAGGKRQGTGMHLHAVLSGLSGAREDAPGDRVRPKAAEGGKRSHRLDGEMLAIASIAEAAERKNGRPGRHGAGIVVTAFWLVPWIAALAVVAHANVRNRFQAGRCQTCVEHQRSGGVFQARPRFCKVRKRDARARSRSVIAHEERGFVVQDIGALYGVVIVQVRLTVVADDRGKSGVNVIWL